MFTVSELESVKILPLQLKKVDRDLRDEIFQVIILKKIRDLINFYIESKYGRVPKVGVFGPYADEGEEVLHYIGQEVSSRGYLAILGRGFYLPNEPDDFYELTELLPPLLDTFLTSIRMSYYLYRYILPSILDRAVDNLYPLRTNVYELEGCYEYQVPVLGFIMDGRIEIEQNECEFIMLDDSPIGISKECIATSESQCKGVHSTGLSCPFYHIADIPLVQKLWFLTLEEWKFIALSYFEKITFYLDIFL